MAARTRRIVLTTLVAGVVIVAVWTRFWPPATPTPEELLPYGEMRIGVDASNPPFAVATADDLYGLEIDLGKALGEYFGVPVHFINMSFDGLYDSLIADQVDLVIAALTVDPLHTGDIRYTRHYFNAGLVLVSPADQPITSMHSLAGHSLAYEFGSNADALARLWLRRIVPFEVQPYELPAYALDAVHLGDADAALVDAVTARLSLRKQKWQAHVTQITNNWYPIAVSIDHGALWKALDDALQAMDDNGTLEQIIDRWL